MSQQITVWSTVQNSRRRFGVGQAPKGAAVVGYYHRPYDPNTGTTSENWSYWPYHHQPQPNGCWLYERMPQ